ncbi:PUM-HD domain-containing protein [Caenorhabditis elegans]|uniref:PUM-HD domain-containing protein n=1 Tax=Caenorhabditis elegans TaxID=6239 RepID=Q8IU00_CAEEL|nr:PUM-HD domain-containing protein [Caenorhabditis elegans]CCD74185.1 PUM-HD domain-containing protein [Caenorhabditis elegans]|eukprot:NP_741425.1 PUF (Pumilio/FBF) domain-containing [Caenorhabditis elegans]
MSQSTGSSNLGRYHESPPTTEARNVSGKNTFGGCFNSNSSNIWTPNRNVDSSMGFQRVSSTPKNASTPYRQGFGGQFSKWRTSTPMTTPARHPQQALRLIDLENNASSPNTLNSSTRSYKCTLPIWAGDGEGNVSDSVTLPDVLANDALVEFATDKNGCRFLQEHYPTESDNDIHQKLFRKLVEDRAIFLSLCCNMFGNFFVQRVLECSNTEEQEILTEHLASDLYNLCLDKSACRVIQLAIQKLDVHLATRLSLELRDTYLVRLSIDQNGNHVIQKIVKTLPVSAWSFVVEFFADDDNLIHVCQDKYGCRVIQSTVETLSSDTYAECYQQRVVLLRSLMSGVTRNCSQLASNEFANYVVQHVIKCGDAMAVYRDVIIEQCLLQNLLSMSQEKYASHVVEVAFGCAPCRLAAEMMNEIFEGYIPHPDTNRDALDILLFHQYGNYVVQKMIQICVLGQNARDQKQAEMYGMWLEKIRERVMRNANRLERFSSGKKIIEALQSMSFY